MVLIVLPLRRILSLPRSRALIWYWAAVAGLCLLTPAVHHAGLPIQLVVLAGVLAILFLELTCRARGLTPADMSFFWAMAAAFAVAITFSFLDVTRTLCDPKNHFFQGHATWHLFSGLGMTLGIFYHRKVGCISRRSSGTSLLEVSSLARAKLQYIDTARAKGPKNQ